MAEVPAWIQASPPVAAYAGAAPAAESGGASFAKMLFAGIAATTLVMWAHAKIRERQDQAEEERLFDEATRSQRALDDHREDLSIAHDWTTAHPLAVRYGQ